jgi:hypothetical protein
MGNGGKLSSIGNHFNNVHGKRRILQRFVDFPEIKNTRLATTDASDILAAIGSGTPAFGVFLTEAQNAIDQLNIEINTGNLTRSQISDIVIQLAWFKIVLDSINSYKQT